MKRLERSASAYCRQVAKKLPFGGAKRRSYLLSLRQDALGYLSTHPWAEPAELREVFGSPEQIAVAFVSEMSYEEINDRFRARNRVLFLVSAAVVLSLLLLGAMIVYLIVRNRQDMDGHMIVTAANQSVRRWML